MVLKVDVPPNMIHGDADDGYGKVADAFRANFAAGHEVGAALCIYHDGTKVVDMWGGYRDGNTKTPWQRDSMVNMFSTTKGIAALTVAHAVSRGLLDYDARVADYWPEFGQRGKDQVTIRQLLAHQAGLCAMKPTAALADVADPDRLAPILAAQCPAWAPGTRHGYHAVTLGWFQSELIRRADPAQRTLGRYLAEELVGPLGLDLHIGLPASVDRSRIAYLHHFHRAEPLLHLNVVPLAMAAAALNPFGLLTRAGALPSDVHPWKGHYNREAVRTVEIPSANGIGTARAVARLYGEAATGGHEIGLTPTTFSELTAPDRPPSGGRRDKALHIESRYSLGFCKPFSKFSFGSSERAFGTPGFGGSFGFADPDTRIGFGYVMNRLGTHLYSDTRELAIRRALFQDVLGTPPQT